MGGGSAQTFTLGSSTTLNSAGLAAALNADTTFSTTNHLTASVSGTTLTIKGAAGSTSTIALTNGFTDTTAGGTPTYIPANNTVTGALGTAATSTLTALASSTNSSFASGSTLSINGTAVSVAGLTGSEAARRHHQQLHLAGSRRLGRLQHLHQGHHHHRKRRIGCRP